MIALAIVAAVIALPQVLYLNTGVGRHAMPSLFHWGYTIDQPTAWNVIKYLGFTDRKSTRLNSSHLGISYAVFCLKKKKNKKTRRTKPPRQTPSKPRQRTPSSTHSTRTRPP